MPWERTKNACGSPRLRLGKQLRGKLVVEADTIKLVQPVVEDKDPVSRFDEVRTRQDAVGMGVLRDTSAGAVV